MHVVIHVHIHMYTCTTHVLIHILMMSLQPLEFTDVAAYLRFQPRTRVMSLLYTCKVFTALALLHSPVMSLLFACKVFTALALLLVAFAGGIAPVLLHSLKVSARSVAACNALAGGVLLAAALVHLLPDATENLQGLGRYLQRLQDPDSDDAFPIASVVAASAFLMLATLESYMGVGEIHNHGSPPIPVKETDSGTACEENWNVTAVCDLSPSNREALLDSKPADSGSKPHSKQGSAHSLVLALAVHSFIEGMSLGAQGHLSSFVGIAVAITAHKGLAGFALGSNMIASCSNTTVYVGVTIFALCSPVGMMVGSEATRYLSATGVGLLIAVASGTFLYCALPDLILPSLHLHGCAIVYFNTFLGMLAMSVLELWV